VAREVGSVLLGMLMIMLMLVVVVVMMMMMMMMMMMIPIMMMTMMMIPVTGMIGKAELSLLGPESIVVNVGRGDVVDEAALYHALYNQQVGHDQCH
jgi:hypothetical protein